MFTTTGIRLSELAGIRCHPDDPARSDLDLQARQIRIRGKGGTARTVKIGHQAARSLDRYLRARARHPQSWRPQLWLGVNNRGPLTATGIYQAVARRGRLCGVSVYPHRFRHHFSHTWLDRGGAERDLMELNGWNSPRCSPGTAPAPAAPAPAAATTASWTTAPDPATTTSRNGRTGTAIRRTRAAGRATPTMACPARKRPPRRPRPHPATAPSTRTAETIPGGGGPANKTLPMPGSGRRSRRGHRPRRHAAWTSRSTCRGPAGRAGPGPSAAGVVHEAAGQRDAVSRAVARDKPVAASVVIPR